MADKRTGRYLSPADRKITIRAYAESWIEVCGLRSTTVRGYRSALKNHILPLLGDVPLADLTMTGVKTWVSDLRAKGLAPASVRISHAVLRSLYSSALSDRLVHFNPAVGVRLERVAEREIEIPTPELIFRLDAKMPETMRGMVVLAAYTGLRKGELLALEVRAYDTKRDILRAGASFTEGDRGVRVHSPGRRCALRASSPWRRRR